jgi:GNAT superfamily N-acetyltransferase
VAVGVDGSVIGWIHIFAAVRLGSEPFAEVGGLIVSEPCRGQGVGKSLFQKAEVWAGEKNLGFLRIRSRSFRSEAHRFYELLGCTPIKTQKVFSKELQSR